MGLRYRASLPTGDMSSLPGSLSASVNTCLRDFLSQDRGSVRAANDKTFDSRANDHVDWLIQHSADFESLSRCTPQQALAIIGTYIRHCNMGLAGCQRKAQLAEKTLGGYIRSAATWWRDAVGVAVPIYQPALPGEKPKLHPFLADILQQ